MKKASSGEDFKDCVGIGVDVSKAELVVVGLTENTPYVRRVENRLGSIRHFLHELHKAGYGGKIVCESTGHYHLKLALVGSELGLDIIVLNPLQSSKHSQARIRKLKTDSEDALTLATMCVTEPRLPKPVQLTAAHALIRLKMGQLAAVEKQLQQGQRSLRQYEETYAELGLELSAVQRALHEHYGLLKKLRLQMESELETLLIEQLASDELFGRLGAIPGYSAMVCGLVGQLDRQVSSDGAWVAYAGLDVSVRQSGTWKGRGKLTKRGNAYLRKRLFQSAWGACMNYAYIRAYYDDLKAQGRRHVEALCIIARKLLRIAYQVIVIGKQYDEKIAFAVQKT
jgi:transposase